MTNPILCCPICGTRCIAAWSYPCNGKNVAITCQICLADFTITMNRKKRTDKRTFGGWGEDPRVAA